MVLGRMLCRELYGVIEEILKIEEIFLENVGEVEE